MALPAISLDTPERGQMALDLIRESTSYISLDENDEAKITVTLNALAIYFFSKAPPSQKQELKDLIKDHTVKLRRFLPRDITLILPKEKTFTERSLLLTQMPYFTDLIKTNDTTLDLKNSEGTLQFLVFLLNYTDWESTYHSIVTQMLSELSKFYHSHATNEQKAIIHDLICNHYQQIKNFITFDSEITFNLNRPVRLQAQSLVFRYFGLNIDKVILIDQLDDLLGVLSTLISKKDLRNLHKTTIIELLDSITEYFYSEATDSEKCKIKKLVALFSKENLLHLFKRSTQFQFSKEISYDEAPLLLANYPHLFQIIRNNEKTLKITKPEEFIEFYVHMTNKRRWESKYKPIFFPLFTSLLQHYHSGPPEKKEIETVFLKYADKLIPNTPTDLTLKMPTFQYKKTFVSFKVTSLILLFDPNLRGKAVIEFKTKEEIKAFLNNLENIGITLPLPPQVTTH